MLADHKNARKDADNNDDQDEQNCPKHSPNLHALYVYTIWYPSLEVTSLFCRHAVVVARGAKPTTGL